MDNPTTRLLYPCVGQSAGVDRRENLVFTGFRSSDLPASSVSLYRLSYPDPHKWTFRLHIHSSDIINFLFPFRGIISCLHIHSKGSLGHIFTLEMSYKVTELCHLHVSTCIYLFISAQQQNDMVNMPTQPKLALFSDFKY